MSQSSNNKKHPQQPWILTTRFKRLSNKKQRLYNKARLSCNPDDFHTCKEDCTKECRNAHNNYLANALNNSRGSKQLWSYIKGKKKELHLYAIMTKFTLMIKIKLIFWTNYFTSVFTVEDAPQTPVNTEDKASEMQSISISILLVLPVFFQVINPLKLQTQMIFLLIY